MSVAIRDVMRATPPPDSGAGREPAITVLGELPIYPGNAGMKNSPLNNKGSSVVFQFTLFHPQSVPYLVSQMPRYFDVHVEEWGQFMNEEQSSDGP